ncbi:MAG: helix-turn-helix transcriptional regulator [Lachnospiraceae bacterium]|nr:helix-turn-helix transcriptional regulator [Lachnospiraceae bacterium]
MNTEQFYEQKRAQWGTEKWAGYIEQNITCRLQVEMLAQQFGYSVTHFKRIFKDYYGMSVADYIRERKVAYIADKIRNGMHYSKAAAMYGFHSEAGISRAFLKDYFVTPAVYWAGSFEQIAISRYINNMHGYLLISYLHFPEIRVKAQMLDKVTESNQIQKAELLHWKQSSYPAVPKKRLIYNKSCREDKFAFWTVDHVGETYEYWLGTQIEEVDDSEESKICCLEKGKYAMFEIKDYSDLADFSQAIDILIECIFHDWCRENEEKIDKSRMIYERYANKKVYFFIPVKE